MIKSIIGWLLSTIFFMVQILGFFFMYALVVFRITNGRMLGWIGYAVMFAAAVLSAYGMMLVVVKWGE